MSNVVTWIVIYVFGMFVTAFILEVLDRLNIWSEGSPLYHEIDDFVLILAWPLAIPAVLAMFVRRAVGRKPEDQR